MKLSDLNLTDEQTRVMKKLIETGDWMSAYRLHTTMNTMNALYKRDIFPGKPNLATCLSLV